MVATAAGATGLLPPRWCGSRSGDAEQADYALMPLTCGAFDTVPAGSDESALARRGFGSIARNALLTDAQRAVKSRQRQALERRPRRQQQPKRRQRVGPPPQELIDPARR